MASLYIVSTPIGNLGDITIRARQVLQDVQVIACEDTRRAAKLLQLLGLPIKQFLRYDNQTEHTATVEILTMIEHGTSVALVSDAGTPLISDPGFILIREARKRNIPIVNVPGASALLSALTSSGLPTNKFLFLGYPPEKQSHRKNLFNSLPRNITIIFYCAPHKLLTTLKDMRDNLSDIDITICRELTKVHEEVWTGSLTRAITKFSIPKGEFVLLLNIPQV